MLGHSVLSFSLKDETIFLKTLGGGDAEAGVHVKVWAVDRVLMVWLCSFITCWVEMPFHILYLQPIITQYFIDNKSEIWLLFLIAHSKR